MTEKNEHGDRKLHRQAAARRYIAEATTQYSQNSLMLEAFTDPTRSTGEIVHEFDAMQAGVSIEVGRQALRRAASLEISTDTYRRVCADRRSNDSRRAAIQMHSTKTEDEKKEHARRMNEAQGKHVVESEAIEIAIFMQHHYPPESIVFHQSGFRTGYPNYAYIAEQLNAFYHNGDHVIKKDTLSRAVNRTLKKRRGNTL